MPIFENSPALAEAESTTARPARAAAALPKSARLAGVRLLAGVSEVVWLVGERGERVEMGAQE